MTEFDSLSIFLPAYNEEENVGLAITSCLSFVKERMKEYEIIIILYEGTTDGTEGIVRDFGRRNPNIRMVYQPESEKGYGGALRLGIENSRYDWIFYTDADNQYDVSDAQRLIDLARGNDIVAGYRIDRKDSYLRLLVAHLYNLYIYTRLGIAFKDIDCAFKLYRREVFEKIAVNCRTGLADAEILAKAALSGFKIAQVPVQHYPRLKGRAHFETGCSLTHMVRPRVVWDIIVEMKRLKRELNALDTLSTSRRNDHPVSRL